MSTTGPGIPAAEALALGALITPTEQGIDAVDAPEPARMLLVMLRDQKGSQGA